MSAILHSLLLDALDNIHSIGTNKDSISIIQNLLHKALNVINDIEMQNYASDDDSQSNNNDVSVSYSDSDSDCSFTDEQRSYIKNKAHEVFLKKYSLKPTYPNQYFDKSRDIDTSEP